ncbi:unnamed protein product, partial [Ectocarpus sp. 8 AP-2014]
VDGVVFLQVFVLCIPLTTSPRGCFIFSSRGYKDGRLRDSFVAIFIGQVLLLLLLLLLLPPRLRGPVSKGVRPTNQTPRTNSSDMGQSGRRPLNLSIFVPPQ